MGKTEKTDLPKSYEAAVAELEKLVTAMEQGDLSLEQSLVSYQRGAILLKYCQARLVDAQERVRVLEAGELKPLADD